MTRYIAFGFQLPLPWRTDPPNFAAIGLRLLTLLRLLVALASVFLMYLVNGADRWNSHEDFLTAILCTPALRRVDSVPDSHSEFSELTGLSRILEFSRLID